jgi:DNA repair protein RecN (Recombination protein N)
MLIEKQTLEKEHEYNSFLLNELLSANLKDGEQEELEQAQEQLSNVEFIKENFSRILSIANEEQLGAIVNLKEIRVALQKVSGFSPIYSQLQERFQSAFLEIEDIINECEQTSYKIIADPKRLELLNTKLQAIYTLQKKHQVQTVQELLKVQDHLDSKVLKVDELENQIAKLQQKFNDYEKEILVAKQDPNYDPNKLKNLEEQRSLLYYEIQRLKRKQWEEDTERVEFDDDR